MATIVKFDVSGVEDRSFETPKPGVYKVKIFEVNDRRGKDGKNDIEVISEIMDKGDYKGSRLWSYISFNPAADWKLKEFVRWLGISKGKGQFDLDKLPGTVGKVKVVNETRNDDVYAKVGKWLPASEEPAGDDTEPDDTEPEEDTQGAGNDDKDYETWDADDLKGEIEDRGLEVPGGRQSKAKLIAVLEEDDNKTDDAQKDDGEPDEPAADDAEPDDYDEWTLEELKDEITGPREAELPEVTGRKTEDKLKAAYIAFMRQDDIDNPFES